MNVDQNTRQGWKRGGAGSRAEAILQTYNLFPIDCSWIRWSSLVERGGRTGPSKPTLSRHLKVLENMGIIERKEDREEYPHPVSYRLKPPGGIEGDRVLVAVIQEIIEDVSASLRGVHIYRGLDEHGNPVEREEPLPFPLTDEEWVEFLPLYVYGALQHLSLGIYYEMLKFKATADKETADRHLENVVKVVILSAVKQITEFASPYLKGDPHEIIAMQHASFEGFKNWDKIWQETGPLKKKEEPSGGANDSHS